MIYASKKIIGFELKRKGKKKEKSGLLGFEISQTWLVVFKIVALDSLAMLVSCQ